ncbi:hypothetical protein N7492_010632, partial [Penicillium capsulatum]
SRDCPPDTNTARAHTPRIATTPPPGTKMGVARRTLGICLLLLVVVLWTTSNFLGSTIFADKTYPKPFFVTYINTALFTLPLFVILISRTWVLWRTNRLSRVSSFRSLLRHLDSSDPKAEEQRGILHAGSFDAFDDEGRANDAIENLPDLSKEDDGKLGLRATATLSIQFCLLWVCTYWHQAVWRSQLTGHSLRYVLREPSNDAGILTPGCTQANYFAMACLQYTTVGSTTILTSTSGVWTLVFGAIIGVEKFTVRKFLGVIASLVGIILISRVDLTKPDAGEAAAADESSGSFPHKTSTEIAIGDAMAAFSSIMYGLYTIVMKKQVGDESRVNMALFFGLVGFFNVILMWPGFFILHWTGVEAFSLPQTQRVWTIVLSNSLTSFVSDLAWAYAMLLTTPLVVTVGLSLTIPLSLVGQIVLQSQYASPMYWVGAAIVFLSFVVVNHESKTQEGEAPGPEQRPRSGEYESVPHEEEMR